MKSREELREWVHQNIDLNEVFLVESHFAVGETVSSTAKGMQGVVVGTRDTGDGEIYVVDFNKYGTGECPPADLTKVSKHVSEEEDFVEDELTEEDIEALSEIFSDISEEERNLIFEQISGEDVKKIFQVGHSTAKSVHGDEYDPEKANKVIKDMIRKGAAKGMGDDDVSAMVQNAFQKRG